MLKAQINGEFKGWSGETIIELTNGEIWKQWEYKYFYCYLYRPNVILKKMGYRGTMEVVGTDIVVEMDRVS